MCYLREICEPLFKPGDLTVELLKATRPDRPDRPDRQVRQVGHGTSDGIVIIVTSQAIGGDNVATFDQAGKNYNRKFQC